MVGTFSGLIVIFWVGVGFQVEKALGRIHSTKLPTSVDQCPRYNITEELTTTLVPPTTALPTPTEDP